TQQWLGGNLQKMFSVTASIATAFFNEAKNRHNFPSKSFGFFDSRVFTIADQAEVANYFVWRTKDAIRNSIQAIAQSLCSPTELFGANLDCQLELIKNKGKTWSSFNSRLKSGGLFLRSKEDNGDNTYTNVPTSELYSFYSELVQKYSYKNTDKPDNSKKGDIS